MPTLYTHPLKLSPQTYHHHHHTRTTWPNSQFQTELVAIRKELKKELTNTKPGCLAKTNGKKIQQRKVGKRTEKAHTKSSKNGVDKRPSQKYIIIHPLRSGTSSKNNLLQQFLYSLVNPQRHYPHQFFHHPSHFLYPRVTSSQ